jgi:hypothetical protein
MRSKFRLIALISGMAGLAAYATRVLAPLPDSILAGSSTGLVLASVLYERLTLGPPAQMTEAPRELYPEAEWAKEVPTMVTRLTRKRTNAVEKALAKFDAVVARLDARHGPFPDSEPEQVFETALEGMNKEIPEWDGEGRVRTYFLLHKIADSLEPRNAEAYMEMALELLKLRPNEAAEFSQGLLQDKAERLYSDPGNDKAKFVAGTLMLINRGKKDYVKTIVSDAIHLWSDTRFDNLISDFEVIRFIPNKERLDILDMVEKEIRKARRANDVHAVLRAREIMDLMVSHRHPEIGVGDRFNLRAT